jgi:ribosomal protein S25
MQSEKMLMLISKSSVNIRLARKVLRPPEEEKKQSVLVN